MQSVDVFNSCDSDQRDYGLGMRALQLLGSLLRRWVPALVYMLQWIAALHLACPPTAASRLLRLPAARVAAGGVCATSSICGTSGLQPGAGSASCLDSACLSCKLGRSTSSTAPCLCPLAAQVLSRCLARRGAAQAVPPAAGGRRACAAQPIHVGAICARTRGLCACCSKLPLGAAAGATNAADNNRCRHV